MSLGILLIGEPQGSWGSRVAKGGRAGLEDLGLVGTPLPRRAVADPASWPRALPDPPPSLHPKPKRGGRQVPLLSQLSPSAPRPSRAGGAPEGEGGRHHDCAQGVREAGGGAWGMRQPVPPATSPAPVTPPPPPTEWFAPSALFNPRDCSSAGSLPVPASAPGSEAARGRPFGQCRRLPLPSPSPWGSRLASAQPGSRPGSAMGAPSALPLLLLFASCWAPGGANLSQDGE